MAKTGLARTTCLIGNEHLRQSVDLDVELNRSGTSGRTLHTSDSVSTALFRLDGNRLRLGTIEPAVRVSTRNIEGDRIILTYLVEIRPSTGLP